MVSVLGQAAIMLVFQLIIYFSVQTESGDLFIECVEEEDIEDTVNPCSENTVLFLFTSMQYLISCWCFSISKPFRKPVYTNPLFFVSFLLMFGYQAYLMVYLDDFNQWLMDLVKIPQNYREYLLLLVILNAVSCFIFERVFIVWFGHYWNKRETAKRELA